MTEDRFMRKVYRTGLPLAKSSKLEVYGREIGSTLCLAFMLGLMILGMWDVLGFVVKLMGGRG